LEKYTFRQIFKLNEGKRAIMLVDLSSWSYVNSDMINAGWI